jgi:beta-mannosidase
MTASVKRSLAGAWQLRQVGGEEWLPASVPGGVHTDLLAAGRIADPFVGDEELRVQWVAEQEWEYRRTVDADAELLALPQIFLVCDGLDTLAEVALNGQVIGAAENMFRQYRWDVRAALRSGANELRILFRSAVRYITERQRERPMIDVNDVIHGAPYIRKAPSHFGWDWGPKLPAIGIWRDLRLEGYSAARLADVHLRQQRQGDQIRVSAAATAERYAETALELQLRLTAPDGRVQTATAPLAADAATIELAVERPQLWWPNGYGAQPLYAVEVALVSGETVVDRRDYQIGLRTIELRQEPDEWGRSFTFVVNGLPIFAKGSNWIPADSFPTRISHAQLDHLLGSAAAAHHNMLRIWGGGYYEDEHLYDLCDRLGLLVWQDFMFACAVYPLNDEALLANLHVEVVEQVRRLRHRASLALWCGNNEIEIAWAQWGGWQAPELADLRDAYDRFFHHTLPGWIAPEDADHAYWASSPSSGTPFEDPNGDAAGDVHQWAVWHALKPFSNYRTTLARFVSEFGFQSLPCMPTVAAYAAPEDWNMTSYIMEHHQKNQGGNGRIVTYLTDLFRIPKNFAGLVYLSQLLQAEAMRVGVEHWRRHPACSGALYWQLNDCWPVASWAGIDYYGRWKAMHYASRRFYAPLLLSVEDETEQMRIFVTNDTVEPWQGQVRWSIETLRGEQLQAGAQTVEVAPLATLHVHTLEQAGLLSDEQRREAVLICELDQSDDQTQRALTLFAPSKHLALADPQIGVEVQSSAAQLTIRLQGRMLARFVELTIEGADVVFSDNYFDLPAGRSVSVTCPVPAGWSAQQAEQALRVRSLFDSYAA